MGEFSTIDLGLAKNIAIIRKPGTKDVLLFVGQSSDGERWVRTITFGAAQALWHYLTALLYPRAAHQLTQRAATAALTIPDSPTIVTTFAAQENKEKGLIEVRAIATEATWNLQFAKEEGYELWAALEDILDVV